MSAAALALLLVMAWGTPGRAQTPPPGSEARESTDGERDEAADGESRRWVTVALDAQGLDACAFTAPLHRSSNGQSSNNESSNDVTPAETHLVDSVEQLLGRTVFVDGDADLRLTLEIEQADAGADTARTYSMQITLETLTGIRLGHRVLRRDQCNALLEDGVAVLSLLVDITKAEARDRAGPEALPEDAASHEFPPGESALEEPAQEGAEEAGDALDQAPPMPLMQPEPPSPTYRWGAAVLAGAGIGGGHLPAASPVFDATIRLHRYRLTHITPPQQRPFSLSFGLSFVPPQDHLLADHGASFLSLLGHVGACATVGRRRVYAGGCIDLQFGGVRSRPINLEEVGTSPWAFYAGSRARVLGGLALGPILLELQAGIQVPFRRPTYLLNEGRDDEQRLHQAWPVAPWAMLSFGFQLGPS